MGAPSIPFATAARVALELAEPGLAELLDPGEWCVLLDPKLLELRELEGRMRWLADGHGRSLTWTRAWADVERFLGLAGVDLEEFRAATREADRRERALLEVTIGALRRRGSLAGREGLVEALASHGLDDHEDELAGSLARLAALAERRPPPPVRVDAATPTAGLGVVVRGLAKKERRRQREGREADPWLAPSPE